MDAKQVAKKLTNELESLGFEGVEVACTPEAEIKIKSAVSAKVHSILTDLDRYTEVNDDIERLKQISLEKIRIIDIIYTGQIHIGMVLQEGVYVHCAIGALLMGKVEEFFDFEDKTLDDLISIFEQIDKEKYADKLMEWKMRRIFEPLETEWDALDRLRHLVNNLRYNLEPIEELMMKVVNQKIEDAKVDILRDMQRRLFPKK